MKKITVAYWHTKIPNCKYEHMQQWEYSSRKRNEILDYLYSIELSAMIRLTQSKGEGIIIWIDIGRFGQR